MNDENLHMTPDPHLGIPEPEIPANEAWNNMAGMLDVEMPVTPPDSAPSQNPPSSGGGGILGSSIQFWSIALIVLSVAGVVTWGILRQTNKPETPVIKNETINAVQHTLVDDPLGSINDSKPSLKKDITSPATIDTHDTKMDLSIKPLNRDNTVHSKPGSQSSNSTKNELSTTSTISSVSKQSEPIIKNIVPEQTVTDKTTTAVNIDSRQSPVIEEKSNDTVKPMEIQFTPPSPDAESAKSFYNNAPTVNTIVNPGLDLKADNTQNNAGSKKSKNSLRMSENLSWQLGVSGNIGEVVQKGRNPNLYYGGMVTGGLWHKKLKAGIETGIGWAVYNDYGSVLNNVRITDSISKDTVNPVAYIDTARIVAYKYRYQYIQVPLFISKQVLKKGKFALDINTGPVIGFLISQRQIPDYTTGPDYGEIISTDSSDYSRLNIIWQWHVMLQLRWNFNDRLSFTLSPSGIFYLNNLYNQSNKPPGIPFGIGVNAGLIYKFK